MFARFLVMTTLALAPVGAHAATLTATFATDFSTIGFDGATAGQTAFEIDFDDSLGTTAGVLEGSEFLSFSWINNPFTFAGSEFRELLSNAPIISGFVEGFRTADFPGSVNPDNWFFRQAIGSSTASFIAADALTYSFTPDPNTSVVPVPAAGLLLLSGLGGLAALSRRTSRA